MALNDRRTSEILHEIGHKPDYGMLTMMRVLDALGDRAAGLCILLLAFFGLSGLAILSGPLIAFLALRMLLGRPALWLPERLAWRQFSQTAFTRRVDRYVPALERLEHYVMPRMYWLASAGMQRLLSLLFLVLAAVSMLPVPGSHLLAGMAMALMGLGLMEKDGLFVLCSVIFAAACLGLMYQPIVLLATAHLP